MEGCSTVGVTWWNCLAPLTLIVAALIVARRFLRRLQIGELNEKSVFITGCDSGFGQLLALKLLKYKIQTFAGCLTKNGCQKLVALAGPLPGQLHAIEIDVRSSESLEKAKDFVLKQLDGKNLWGVVCNAGVSYATGPDDFLTIDDYIKAFDVNTFGVIRTCHVFKPLLKKSKGRLVIMCSILGRLALPQLCPYVATKFAVEGYADTLRIESSPFGFSVHLIEPGFFQTDLTNVESNIKNLERLWNDTPGDTKFEYGENFLVEQGAALKNKLSSWVAPDLTPVVDAYFSALTSKYPSYRYVVGLDANFFFWPLSLVPSRLMELLIVAIQKLHGMPQPAISHQFNSKKSS